ncbi:Uncharacterised protein [Enterobacter hormaechei]|nr:Uncharacterised protein [Enterobacter hormaechei]
MVGNNRSCPGYHPAVDTGLHRHLREVKFLELQTAAAQVDIHPEPVQAPIEIVRAAQPLLECALLRQREYPRQRPGHFQVVGLILENSRADRWLIGLKTGIESHVFAGLLRQRKPVGIVDNWHQPCPLGVRLTFMLLVMALLAGPPLFMSAMNASSVHEPSPFCVA